MPEIQLTPETLRSEAQKLTSQRDQLTETVNKIKALVDALEGGWHGLAQQAFVASFNEKKAVYDKFAEDMGGFATFMTNYAATMEQADSGAKSGLNF